MMIRVNLNPARKTKQKSGNEAIAFICAVIVVAVALGISYVAASNCKSETENLASQNASINSEIAQVQKRIEGIQKAQQARKELQDREMTLARLASIRRGPQFVLNEFARILSNPRDVVARKEASENGWLLAWEPDNILVKSLKDIGNSEIQIDGTARAMDDVYEFWTRMKTSKLLRNVELVEIKGARESSSGEQAQAFIFKMGANFNYQTKEGLALVELLTSEQNDIDSPNTPNNEPNPKS